MKTILHTETAPKAIGPYSQAVKANGFLFISGQTAFDPNKGETVTGTIEEQTKCVLENIKKILHTANLNFENVVKATVFLQNMQDFIAMNQIYATYFDKEPPARSCIQAAQLPKQAAVEIEIIAAYD